ncbi:titin [Diachasma alloeum]|uniref:titin n=1 Tax=Diachasma alloeum TaxID=454923 RepID=UPI00073828AE|nr:titin [Diachasma alloeum]
MDQVDGDYLGSYRRFLVDFVESMDPDDQLPVKMTGYDVREAELVGEVIDMTLQYLNQKYCPPSLQSHIVHLVIEEIKTMCRKQPEACGLRPQEKTYAPLKLMQAVTGKVNEICQRYLENSRLALLPPPPSTPLPLTTVYAIKNTRRKMEDRHVVLHDLNTIFNIQDESTASYYAVFDGHLGPEAAVYCTAHLHQYLAESVHYPTDPERALRDAFVTTDAHFVQKSQDLMINSGATALCALIINRKLYVAWAGDSQAALAKRGNVTQLVNPHRPDRTDEKDRVIRMGGSVMYYGMWRVDGNLAVSRAIGDAQYKPYVTGDPEIRCVMLDGSEDFLVIACDGLWDYIDETTAAGIVYQQICHDPQNLQAVSQRLVEYSKNKGSSDNITVIVVFLTPPNQIATRFTHNHPLIADVELNNMEPDNRYFSSATGQYEVNAGINAPFGKGMRNQNNGGGFDEDEFPYSKSSNGRHENGAVDYDEEEDEGEEDDDDDLGPESNVDAVDEAGEVCTLANVSRELFPDESPKEEVLGDGVEDTGVRHSGSKKNVHDPENVGDSEDSDDEWNYYRVDSDKVKNQGIEVAERCEDEQLLGTGDSEIQKGPEAVEIGESEKERENEVEEKETVSSDSEREARQQLTDPEIREQPPAINLPPSPEPSELHQLSPEEMDFQLNPNAAEFIPVSPAPTLPTRILDLPISGSPLKQTPMMDDIRVPSPSEFQEEVSHRPSEIEGKIVSPQNGDPLDEKMDQEKVKPIFCLDESEVSSTKAEFGDESTASFLTNPDYHRNPGLDGSFTSSCSAFENDPMIMSFGPGDFNPLNSNPVDLNAVHDLTDADLLADGNSTGLQDEERDNDVHPELADLISPDSDQPKPSDAFPDHQMNDMFGNMTLEQQMEERIEQEVEAMNLKNTNQEELACPSNGGELPLVYEEQSIETKVESPESIEPEGLLELRESPLEVRDSPLEVRESPLEVRESPLEVESPLGVTESPLEVPETFDLMSCDPPSQNPFVSSSTEETHQDLITCSLPKEPEISSPKQETMDVDPLAGATSPVSDAPDDHLIHHEDLISTTEDKSSPPEEPVAIKLSESLQEFTGLEEQFNPLEKDSGVETPVAEDLRAVTDVIASSPESIVQQSDKPQIEVSAEPLEPKQEQVSVAEIEPPVTEAPVTPVTPVIAPAAPEKEPEKDKTPAKPKTSATTKALSKPPTKTVKSDVKSAPKALPTSPNKLSPRPSAPATKKTSPRPATKPPTSAATVPKPSKPPAKAPTPRIAPIPPKPKSTTGASRLTATKTSVTDKKPPGVVNGDVKTAKPKMASSKPPVKPSVGATRPTTAPPKPKVPLTSVKTSTGAATGAGVAAKPQRPKTAPSTSTTGTLTSKTRISVAAKPPVIDKQIKETANKQISSSRISITASSVKKTTTISAAASARRVTTTTVAGAGAKKPGATRTSGKPTATAVNGKTASRTPVKAKLQNGVCDVKKVEEEVKIEEDVPQKDVSPVEVSNDNQLIITAE